MSSSTNAFRLNKKAIFLLREGRSQAAVWALTEALAQVRTRLQDQQQQKLTKTSCTRPRRSLFKESLAVERSTGNGDCTSSSRRRKSPFKTVAIQCQDPQTLNLFEFYNRAFVLRSGQEQPSSKTEYLVLLYNLAVTHHRAGIQRADDSILQRATSYYTMAETVLNLQWEDLEADLRLNMALAIANNVGHVHSHLLNLEETKSSLGKVQRLLADHPLSDAILPNKDHVFFSRTTLIFNNNFLSIAPAA